MLRSVDVSTCGWEVLGARIEAQASASLWGSRSKVRELCVAGIRNKLNVNVKLVGVGASVLLFLSLEAKSRLWPGCWGVRM